MFNRCTYIDIDKRFTSSQGVSRLNEPNRDSVFIYLQYHDISAFNQYHSQHYNDPCSNQYLPKRISPDGLMVNFPSTIWGFSLLHTPFSAGSFGVLNKNLHQETR
jgi:hypothetical protein